jgi:acetyltransferase-like isoleucine patch superfamily enzyme
MLLNYIKRLKAMRQTSFTSEQGEIFFNKNVKLHLDKSARLNVGGKVHIGFTNPGAQEFPSFDRTVISLGKDARINFLGDVFISSGVGIYVRDGGEITFKGNNFIARNATFLCFEKITLGFNTSTSWNFIAFDTDGHEFHKSTGEVIPKKINPLTIGDNVAIQVNVMIPKGINIGNNAVIGPNTTIRQDIPDNVLVYHKQEMTIKEGVSFGFQFHQ